LYGDDRGGKLCSTPALRGELFYNMHHPDHDPVVPDGHIPKTLTMGFIGRVVAKWVVVGATTIPVDLMLGPVIGFVGHVAADKVVRSFDP
jgi:hypothetical protein